MNKYFSMFALLMLSALTLHRLRYHEKNVNIYTSEIFYIPKNVKHLALLGCTPQPGKFVQQKCNVEALKNIKLNEFLDIEYLRDSFTTVLTLCKNNNIDHLLIAYLPVYFVDLKQILGSQFIEGSIDFFNAIKPQIQNLLQDIQNDMHCAVPITIIIPTIAKLKQIPNRRIDNAERIQFLIKQFPKIGNLNSSHIEMITIINNKGSDQNEDIINYLSYEYLLDKKLNYGVLETNKEKFHKYI